MHRLSVAIALSTLLFVSVCSAQQTATTSRHTTTSAGSGESTTKSGGGTDTIVNCPSAQNGRIAVFTGAAPPNITLCNSGIYEAAPYGTGAIGILNPNPVAALDVNGDINTSASYQIAGATVLSSSAAQANVFVGPSAGGQNPAGFADTVVGATAGYANTSGMFNSFFGSTAGYSNTTGNYNTFSGVGSGFSNTTGSNNTFSGSAAGYHNNAGSFNAFFGSNAGSSNAGSNNTFVGEEAGSNNTTGSNNTFVGYQAGVDKTTGSNNVYIANYGSFSGESSAMRIGNPSYQTTTYIVGIYGATSSGGIPVYINSNGQLGTSSSSLRFKEQVRDMGDSTNALMKLRPVTFLYKPEYANGERTLQYGLIAEEVAKVYPELVANDNDGQPYTVRYQYLTTMLLSEAQKQYHRAEAQAEVIKVQEQKIDDLEQRLSRLERLIPQTVAQK